MLIIYETPSWIGFEVEAANKVLEMHVWKSIGKNPRMQI